MGTSVYLSEEKTRPEPLTPMWMGRTGIALIDKMPQRPVLLKVPATGAMLRGEVITLGSTKACVLPVDPLLIWNNTAVTIKFRFRDTIYTLSGTTSESYPDRSFTFLYDEVTREQVLTNYAAVLREAGLMENLSAPKSTTAPAAAASTARENASSGALPPVEAAKAQKAKEKDAGEQKPTKAEILHALAKKLPDALNESFLRDVEIESALHLINDTQAYPCELIRLGEGGGLAYFNQPPALGLGTATEIRFTAHGVPYRFPTFIQEEIHPQVLQLAFQEMSPRIRTRLKEYLKEI